MSGAPERPVADFAAAQRRRARDERIELFRALTSDPYAVARDMLASRRRAKLDHYEGRPLNLFVQFDSFGDEWHGSVTEECMSGGSVARLLVPPGVPPDKLRAALEAFADDYAKSYEAIQDDLARHATRLLGLCEDFDPACGFDDLPF